MTPRQTRNAIAPWMTSAVVHLTAWAALSWSFTQTMAEFSLETSENSGEISSIMMSATSVQTSEVTEISPPQPEVPMVAEIPEPTVLEEPPPIPASSETWADSRISHRPMVVRERMPRSVAMANLDALERLEQVATVPPTPHPKELPPICQELWRRTTDLPKQIDFAAMEQLLQKVAAPTVALIETDQAMESPASVQGTKVDTLPKPGPKNRPPAYPAAARLSGQAGRVLLAVVVAADGSAKDVRLSKSSGHPALDDAALAAVRTWRFEPAKRNGIAVELEIDVPIRFRLTP